MPRKPRKDLVKEPVIESNEIARARISPSPNSVWELRILQHIVTKNRENDKAFAVHKISTKELANTSRLSTRQHREVKKAVSRLGHMTIELPMQGRGAKFFPAFAEIDIDDAGNIEAQINPRLKPHYLGLEENFTLYALPEFRALTSIYSQLLFRYLHSWKNLNKGVYLASLEELHFLLSPTESLKKDFSLFRARILEPAHREITGKTSLKFDWEPIRKGLRKVIAVRFVFDANAKHLADEKTSNDEHAKLQRESNACFERLRQNGKECKPKPRSKRCRFCVERGRMYGKLRQKELSLGVI